MNVVFRATDAGWTTAGFPGEQDAAQRLADAMGAALAEIGRSDLTSMFLVFDEDEPYAEPFDDDLDPDDLALILKAEQVARKALR